MIACFSWLLLFPRLVFVLGKSGIRSLLVDVISDDRRFVDCLNSDLLVSGDVVLLLLVFPACCHFPVLVLCLVSLEYDRYCEWLMYFLMVGVLLWPFEQ